MEVIISPLWYTTTVSLIMKKADRLFTPVNQGFPSVYYGVRRVLIPAPLLFRQRAQCLAGFIFAWHNQILEAWTKLLVGLVRLFSNLSH